MYLSLLIALLALPFGGTDAGSASPAAPSADAFAPSVSNPDTLWLPGDGLPFFRAASGVPWVNAVAAGPEGVVYAGGNFTRLDETPIGYVAQWRPDGNGGGAWSALGEGTGGQVHALAVDADGSLFVAGAFSEAGGQPANRVARWTPGPDGGGSWSPVGAGLNGTVFALGFGPEGALYAAGVPGVARWDAAAEDWVVLGGWFEAARALAWSDAGDLYVGGAFSGGIRRLIPDEDGGGAWVTLGAGTGGAVLALAFGPDGALYAGGSFRQAGGQTADRVARWQPDGEGSGSWSALGSGTSAAVFALHAGADGALYVGGEFASAGGIGTGGMARWTPGESPDEGMWSAVRTNPPTVRAFASASDGAVYVGGRTSFVPGVADTHLGTVHRWQPEAPPASVWSFLGNGLTGTVEALAVAPDGEVLAAGRFGYADGHDASGLARSTPADGGRWHAFGTGLNGSTLAVAVADDGTVYVGGTFTEAGGVAAANVARWVPDGAGGGIWEALGEGVAGGSVRAIAVDADGTVYVGGTFTEAGGAPAGYVARWVPGVVWGTWSTLGEGMNDPVYDLAFGPDGLLYAAGAFTTADGAPASRVARWTPGDASGSWSGLDGGLSAPAHALAFTSDGTLFLGGESPQLAGAIRMLSPDGVWSTVATGASGVNRDVYALAVGPDGALYVGGRFTTAGGLDAHGVARWSAGDGGSWSTLGSGLAHDELVQVFDLAFDPEGVLHVGGTFLEAGSGRSAFYARWAGAEGSVSVHEPEALAAGLHAAFPNPFSERTTIAFELATPGPVRVTAYDVMGREVARLAEGFHDAGRHEVVWRAGGLANGIYVIRLSGGPETGGAPFPARTHRVTLAR